MRLFIANPNTSEEMTESIGRSAEKYARRDTEIVARNPERGPESIEGYFDESIATEAVLDLLLRHRGQFDAYVIGCFGDPGLFAAREVMNVPVIGIAEAAMLKHRCASIRAVELSVLDTETKSDEVKDRLVEAGRLAVENDRAEVLLLGCAGMTGLDKEIEKKLGVPVLDGVGCAVKLAEGLVDYGVTTSKVCAYKHPEPKKFKGCSDPITTVGQGLER